MRRRLDARTQTSRANRRHRRFLTALKAWDRNKDCHPLRVTWAPKVAHRLESVGQGTGLSRRADHAKGTEGCSPPSKRETRPRRQTRATDPCANRRLLAARKCETRTAGLRVFSSVPTNNGRSPPRKRETPGLLAIAPKVARRHESVRLYARLRVSRRSTSHQPKVSRRLASVRLGDRASPRGVLVAQPKVARRPQVRDRFDAYSVRG